MELSRITIGSRIANFTVIPDVFKSYRYLLTYHRFLHSDSVESVGSGHCFLGVGDNDKASEVQKVFQHIDEATNVCLVERSIDFIQNTKRARSKLEDG